MLTGSRDHPFCYLVEWYQAGLTDELLEQAVARINKAGEQLADEGVAVELLGALIVPDDEVAFCLFTAESSPTVEQICHRAGIPPARIAEASKSTTAGRGIGNDGSSAKAATAQPNAR